MFCIGSAILCPLKLSTDLSSVGSVYSVLSVTLDRLCGVHIVATVHTQEHVGLILETTRKDVKLSTSQLEAHNLLAFS